MYIVVNKNYFYVDNINSMNLVTVITFYESSFSFCTL